MAVFDQEHHSSLVYRRLRHRIRPARVVTAMQAPEQGWEHSMLRMLENYSVTWGGSGNLVIPTGERGEVHSRLWSLIEDFDADLWAWYVPTYRGHRVANPESFEQWLQARCEKWASEHGGTVEGARQMLTTERMLSSPTGRSDMPENLVEEIKSRTGPAMRGGQLHLVSFRAGALPGGFLVNVLDLSPLPDRVYLLECDDLPLSLRLLVAMRFGALADEHVAQLERLGMSTDKVLIDENDLKYILPFCWLGRGGLYRTENEALLAAREASGSDEGLVAGGPNALSMAGLVRRNRSHFESDMHLTVVVGSQAHDFAYALALERCGAQVLWLPGEFAAGSDDLSKVVLQSLVDAIRTAFLFTEGRERSLEICSLSLPTNELGVVAERIRKAWPMSPGLEEFTVVDKAFQPPFRIPLIADPRWYDQPLEEPFRNEEMQRGVPAAVPTGVQADDPWKINWWVDVEDYRYRFPARSVLNELVTADREMVTCIARSSKDGISHYSHTMWVVLAGSSLEQMIERPRLRFPSTESVFRHLLNSAGYTMTESPEGRFRRLTTDLWGGREALHNDIVHEGTFALVRAWLSQRPSGEDPGAYNKKRRYLSLEDAVNASGMTTVETRRVLDSYLERGIVKRGHCFQCLHCLSFDWYPLEQVGQSFRCQRCSTENPITLSSWKVGDEPNYYYDLAEVAYQAFSNNVQVPSRALARLAENSRSFDEMPNVEVHRDNESKIELDLWALVDGRVVIGEAKSGVRIKKNAAKEQEWLRRLADVAKAITADVVVFATATSWREQTRTHIHAAFQNHRAEVRLMEGT